MRVLILGGTTEASALAKALAGRRDLAPLLSLAGRTSHPAPTPIPVRTGGFGGVDGLARFLAQERIAVVMDATHPFAARMSAHAAAACASAGVPLAVFTRPAWRPDAGDDWRSVGTLEDAAAALGPEPARVFLTTGRLGLAAFRSAPQHRYLVRTIDPPAPADMPPDCRVILARGPFDAASETALMRAERVDVLVTKNSGGAAGAGKLASARCLGLPVVMVERPPDSGRREAFDTLVAVLGWIETHRSAP